MLESMGTHRIIFRNRGKVIGKGLDLESLMIWAVWVYLSKCVQFQGCIKCHAHSDTHLFGSLVVDVNVYRNRGLACLGTNELICLDIQTDNQ